MLDREMILGVLGVQAGFVTPTQVMSAAAAQLVERDGPALLARLQHDGALTSARRSLLEAMADEAMVAWGGDARRVLESFGGRAAVDRTFGQDELGGHEPTRRAIPDAERTIPDERPGQYTRFDELGRGGQSIVRRAVDEYVGRDVALKELLARPAQQASSSAAARERFLREARLTAQLDHPSIVAVHELARRPDGTLFCAQKLIRGETLKARLARCESLSERLALLPHVIDVCHGVAYAHSRGVIHRDLKPSNIMVGAFGETVIVDWGLAKKKDEGDPVSQESDGAPEPGLTVAGVALGTPAYMSPEQARGDLADIDERSDVFSLGVILYELLTARLPFEGAEAEQMIASVVRGQHRPVRQVSPEVPAELAAVAERALRRDPRERYPGAEPLAKELSAYLAGGRVAAYEYGAWEVIKKFIGNHRALSAVSLAALCILVGASIAIAHQLHVTRLALADSFLERARNAEQSSDWGRAAGYYAAARIESDSRESRWGSALAHQKMPRRTLARRAADRSFVDVGYLADGRALVIGLEPPWVIARDPESGRELWRHQHSEPLTRLAMLPGGQLRLQLQSMVSYLDGATGRQLASFARDEAAPCPAGAVPSRALLTAPPGGDWSLIVPDPPGAPHVLMPSVGAYPLCAVSPDGERLALKDGAGVVHLWDLGKRAEVTSRFAPDAGELLFTAHGVAIVRGRTIQVLGGAGGDFFVALPSRGGTAVASPDGHLLVVARQSTSQADIVDLRVRSVVSSLSFPSGAARFAFSPRGDHLLVAGILDGAVMSAWDLRAPAASQPVPGDIYMGVRISQDGQRILIASRTRVAIHDPSGAQLQLFNAGDAELVNGTISADGTRFAVATADHISVHDTASGAERSRIDFARSSRLELSADGGRLLASNRQETALWDVERRQAIWREGARARPLGGPLAFTPDGRTVVWGREGVLYFHTDGGSDQELALGENLLDATFSHDSSRLAVVSSRSISVWELDGLRPVFRVANPSPVYQEIYWSGDDSALFNIREFVNTELLDSRSGRRLATFEPSKPAGLAAHDVLSPDLRYRIARGDGSWDIRPLPSPDEQSPEASLGRVMEDAGLEMRGVELVYAAPK